MMGQVEGLDVALWLLWFVVSAGVLFVFWTGPLGAPWFPMPRRAIRTMLQMAEVQPGDLVYDLGSGDGRILIMAARDFGARAVGIELDPLRCWWSRMRVRRLGLQDRVKVIRGNVFEQDLAPATVITVYLVPKANNRLARVLAQSAAPGTRLVTHLFIMPGWKPVAHDAHYQLYAYQLKK